MAMRANIPLGFVSIIPVFTAAIVLSVLSPQQASDGITEYRELARESNLAGRLQANMLMVRMNLKDFIITGSDRDLEHYNDYFEAMFEFMAEAQGYIQNPDCADLTTPAGVVHLDGDDFGNF